MHSAVDSVWVLAGWITFGLKVYAFADVSRRPAEAFPFLNRLTKQHWYTITIASFVCHWIFGAWGLTGIAGLIACAVYLVDIRPKIQEMQEKKY